MALPLAADSLVSQPVRFRVKVRVKVMVRISIRESVSIMVKMRDRVFSHGNG